MGRLEDKTAIITGAAGGLGAAYARRFLDEGANVVIADISDAGQETAAELGKSHPQKAVFCQADITDSVSCDRVATVAVDAFGRLDILVNNAALYGDFDAFNNDVDHLRTVLDVNVVGQWLTRWFTGLGACRGYVRR